MCCLVIFGFFHSLLCYGTFTHYFSLPLLERRRPLCCSKATPALKTPTPTPPGQPIARYFPPVTQKSPPPRFPHESSLTEGQLGGWDHTRGEGAQEVEQGFRYINPRATVVTHSLTQNHHGPRQSLTHTATSQLVMEKNFCCKEGSSFPTNGKAFQDNTVKSTVN